MKTILILIVLFNFIPRAHAQADRGGLGGNWTEADLKHFLTRLVPYLQSEEAKRVFPEIVSYDLTHPNETIESIATEMNPRLTEKPVLDASGNVRDCVSYFAPIRYFECNTKSLPPKPEESASDAQKSEYYGTLYRLVLHEVLVQAGLEHPLTVEVPSDYSISSRLMVHLENFPEWVPGASSAASAVQSSGPVHIHAQWSVGAIAGYYVGDFHYGITLREQFPVTLDSGDFKFGYAVSFTHGTKENDPILTVRPWELQILFEGEYDFKPLAGIKPHLRFGMGMAMVDTKYQDPTTENDGLGNTTVSYQLYETVEANFVAALTLGFSFGKNDQYFFEVPFTITPHVGASVLPTLGFHF